MKKIVIYLLCLLSGCKIVDPAGNDKHLIGTSWRSDLTNPPDYIQFDSLEGENGFYYAFNDSCYNVMYVDVQYGRLIIGDESHSYVVTDSLLRVEFPVYSAEFPNTVVGHIEERFVRTELDSTSLSYCN
ncbi:hypothetical protein F9K33_16420 [bacterium]|nr:MAG: hypothetical protein F9K33_16420 [bacterium]